MRTAVKARGLAIPADPFAERRRPAFHERLALLGGHFHFETDSRRLLQIIRQAYEGLPRHALGAPPPRFRVRLALASGSNAQSEHEVRAPPGINTLAAGGILCGTARTASFAALSPEQRSALIVISPEMLGFPYHVRYELLEFAVYVLASRVQTLVPLHAACVGIDGRGILLLGESGAGKSTLSLQFLMQGFDFLAEDSVLVRPAGLLATGIANFLHLRADSLHFVAARAIAARIRKSPVIRRRSGIEKLEIDLRRLPLRLAPAPLRIVAMAFISPRAASTRGSLLMPLSRSRAATRLAADQPYAAGQPGWRGFVHSLSRIPAFELRRGQHPAQAVEEVRELLVRARTPGQRSLPR